MIVNRMEKGWEVVYQPAHALLSAQLAGQWQMQTRPIRWWQTLDAVAQHDNGWHEWEVAPKITNQGAPRNFTQMTPSDAIAQWRRGIARGVHQNRWVGLLISRHATSLYEGREGELEELHHFLSEQLAQQQRWMQQLNVTEEQVERAYAMIRWTDWLSLILCWRRLPANEQPISVGKGSDGLNYQVKRCADGTITLYPWPFESVGFTVSVETRQLEENAFADDAALAEALANAPLIVRKWEFLSPKASYLETVWRG